MERLAALLVLLALISTAFALQTDEVPLNTTVIDENIYLNADAFTYF